jgi:twinkle protein
MAVYDDGHGFCFSCNTHVPEVGEARFKPKADRSTSGIRLGTEYKPLLTRLITEVTCKHFNYSVGEYSPGKRAQFAPYYDKRGKLVAAKVRFPNKDFKVIGNLKEALPFGAHAFPKTGKMVTVTEGEIDAMTMSQVQGNEWPVVSVGNGAAGARKFIAQNLDYFNGFEKVVLMFDQDPAGQKVIEECAAVLGTRARVASLPNGKDPNDMLVEGLTKDLINAMWRAKKHVPSGIVDILDPELEEKATKEIVKGISWPWPTVTELTHGIRTGEIYTFGAGTGAGKTNLFLQLVAHLVEEHGAAVGLFFLEQEATETATRLCGHLSRKILHVDADILEVRAAWDYMRTLQPNVFMYDSFGYNEWSEVEDRIRYLAYSEGVKYFVLDHITAMASADNDERVQLDAMMRSMGELVKELDCTLFVVSHLTTPEKGSHEEGAPVKLREFRGSRSIGMWTHYAVGIERNQVAESPEERCRTRVKFLKDRYAGTANGEVVVMDYNPKTGQLEEAVQQNPFLDGEEDTSDNASSF